MKILSGLLLPLLFVFFLHPEKTKVEDKSRSNLEQNFDNPRIKSKLKAYWLWVNGNVTKESIKRDLEEMKIKGFGGAVLCDMDRSYIGGNIQAPHGPDFNSQEWRELYKYTLTEANRLGLEISLNITSGWAMGGPMITLKDAPKKLVWKKFNIKGPVKFNQKLEEPIKKQINVAPHRAHEKPVEKAMDSLYADIVVVAYPKNKFSEIKNWEVKALHEPLHISTPETKILFDNVEDPKTVGIGVNEVIDLSGNLSPDGTLTWDAPEGEWEILRLGYTTYNKGMLWSSSEGWTGFPLDVFDAKVFQKYWNQVVDPLIADAGDLAGVTLKYLHTDSWEIEPINWTPAFREEFKKRRGYDILPFVPALVGNVVGNSELSDRFLHDFRKTFGDLVIDNHYKIFRDKANQKKIQIHPESGGPHAVPIDAQQCLGMNDVPMSEFWAKAKTHRVTDEQRFFVKQPASAAHSYGHKIVMAEGFTSVGPHWQETLWDNLKPSFDKAACEGMNLLVWHEFSCSPKEMGIPGQDSFAGTHFNPNATWWSRSEAFLSYINRSQVMLQHGLFVADVAYYYGDHVPNFAQLKSSDPCRILPGYDYDVVTEEVILNRMDVSGGKIVLPDGMNYKVLLLPEYPGFSLPVLKKIKELLLKGAIVVGPKPEYKSGLTGYPAADSEFVKLTNELWGNSYTKGPAFENKIGNGCLYAGIEVREILKRMEIQQDFSVLDNKDNLEIDYIHRSDSLTDIYFISNQTDNFRKLPCKFRISGKQPEFWDAVSGEKRNVTEWTVENGCTQIPIELAPYGSVFVVFSKKADPPKKEKIVANYLKLDTLQTLSGDWNVNFDEKWGGPRSVTFHKLISWTEHPDSGIKYYSGTATYKQNFNLKTEDKRKLNRFFIDLGDVKELAEIRLNGKKLGIVWNPPFRVEIIGAILVGENNLEIDVVNFWPNRIIGDQFLPVSKQFTKTNITAFKKDSPLSISGLLGPVTILRTIN